MFYKLTLIEKPDEEKSICPFDATHHVNKEDYDEHVKNCPNRKIVDSEKYAIETDAPPEEGAHAPPTYNFPELPPCEENWDDPSEPAYTYDPTPHLENQPILRTMHGATKSERKAFRQVERMKMLQFISGQPMDTAAASSAAGVTIEGGRPVGRGRGQNRLPLGRGNPVGAGAGTPVNLDDIVGDRVGHILPCPVEAGPLRQPRGTSVALAIARSGEEAAKEEIPEILPSGGAIRKVKQPQVQPEENFPSNDTNADKGGWNKVVSRSKERNHQNPMNDTNAARGGWTKLVSSSKRESDQSSRNNTNGQRKDEKTEKRMDWWGFDDQQKKPSTLLEEYKEQTLTTRIAANMGFASEEKDRTDEERAKDFTYQDEEWQTQMRRGRRGGMAGRRGLGRP
ncbi:hypothetical protein J437_LFUL003216 [Ladona fulva]|uniref:CHHC U11-48K-type domain-containing protein n=1 Tax=Ladona fulva TaxID=123851 RepID=A0A8K0NWQ5_LADFU|nr:hypothetical protein J437_LFUL003216 [Ladona fulva]